MSFRAFRLFQNDDYFRKTVHLDLMERNKFTPDIARLERREHHLVFLCGETMPGYPQGEIAEAVQKFTGFTFRKYEVWLQKTIMIDGEEGRALRVIPFRSPEDPYVTRDYKDYISHRGWYHYIDKFARVKGKVIETPTKSIISLDRYYQNGVEFRRTRGKILIPYVKINKEDHTTERAIRVQWAWIYEALPEFWDKVLSKYTHSVLPRYAMQGIPGWRTAIKNYYALTKKDIE